MSTPASASTEGHISYNQFEADVREGIYQEATVDGNIVLLTNKDGKQLRVEAPNAPRAVELLVKFEVPVKAYQAVPASGMTWPMVVLLLIPYGVLAFYAFALAAAARPPSGSQSGPREEPEPYEEQTDRRVTPERTEQADDL